MKSISQRFRDLQRDGRKALIPYLMSGFPDRARFVELAQLLQDEGADLLEVGVPFSDPLADGPVIQAAGQHSLEQGTTLEQTLQDVHVLAQRRPDVPILLMSYLNPMRTYGLERLAADGRDHGVRGWIVPDRDLDDPQEILRPARSQGIDVVPLLAPTSPNDRIPRVLRGAGGFVYLVSLTGVTGARPDQRMELDDYVSRVRERTSLPLCVGFGVSGADQARAATRRADGVIVGSALLHPFMNGTFEQGRREMVDRVQDIRTGLRSG